MQSQKTAYIHGMPNLNGYNHDLFLYLSWSFLAGKGSISRCKLSAMLEYYETCSILNYSIVCPFQLNPDVSAFQRKFTNDVRRCDEMERKLRFLLNELEKAGIEPRPSGSVEAPDPQGEGKSITNSWFIQWLVCVSLADETKPSIVPIHSLVSMMQSTGLFTLLTWSQLLLASGCYL